MNLEVNSRNPASICLSVRPLKGLPPLVASMCPSKTGMATPRTVRCPRWRRRMVLIFLPTLCRCSFTGKISATHCEWPKHRPLLSRRILNVSAEQGQSDAAAKTPACELSDLRIYRLKITNIGLTDGGFGLVEGVVGRTHQWAGFHVLETHF